MPNTTAHFHYTRQSNNININIVLIIDNNNFVPSLHANLVCIPFTISSTN